MRRYTTEIRAIFSSKIALVALKMSLFNGHISITFLSLFRVVSSYNCHMPFDLDSTAPKACQDLQRLLILIVSAIVKDPHSVRVNIFTTDDRSEFQMSVAPMDVGAVIGSKGRTARALRTLIGAISVKQGKRFSLTIADAPSENL